MNELQFLGFTNVTETIHTNVNCGMHRNARYTNTPVIVGSAYVIEHRCKRCGDGFKSPTVENIREAWAQAEHIRNKRGNSDWIRYCRMSAEIQIRDNKESTK
jgi:hypothetical protein